MGGWLVRLLLFVIVVGSLVRAVWRLLVGVVDGAAGQTRRRPRREVESVPLVKDPVCGTYVPKSGGLTARRGERTEYFCSERCRDEYLQGE